MTEIFIPKDKNDGLPIKAIFPSNGNRDLSIIVEEGSNSSLIIEFKNFHNVGDLDNFNIDIVLNNNSNFKLYSMQDFINQTAINVNFSVKIMNDVNFNWWSGIFRGNMLKENLDIKMLGQGGKCSLNSFYIAGKNNRIDIAENIYHKTGRTRSFINHKGAVAENGRSVYTGLIKIEKNASKSDAFLQNKNLLLGEKARADSRPKLEIENDDVKVGHGSSTGRIGDDEIFYLMSKGIRKSQAEKLILMGFFGEFIENMPDDYTRDKVDKLIQSELEV